MILTGKEILKELHHKRVTIQPFNAEQLNPNSYNYRISDYIAIPEFDTKTNQTIYTTIAIPKGGYILEPGCTYLSHTYEKLGSDKYAMSLIGRSSLGRLGLFLQVSADLGHTRSMHHWTLEIVSCKRFVIYPRMIIGQISFWENYGTYYDSCIRYNKFDFLTASID
jgi:dCTP deaminase